MINNNSLSQNANSQPTSKKLLTFGNSYNNIELSKGPKNTFKFNTLTPEILPVVGIMCKNDSSEFEEEIEYSSGSNSSFGSPIKQKEIEPIKMQIKTNPIMFQSETLDKKIENIPETIFNSFKIRYLGVIHEDQIKDKQNLVIY